MNESDLSRWQAMNEIIPNLWIGDLSAALAADLLQAHNIKFIISAMRGRVKINPVSTENPPSPNRFITIKYYSISGSIKYPLTTCPMLMYSSISNLATLLLKRHSLGMKDCWCIARRGKVRSLHLLHIASD